MRSLGAQEPELEVETESELRGGLCGMSPSEVLEQWLAAWEGGGGHQSGRGLA